MQPEWFIVCAWCKRERTWDGQWVERFSPDPVSHGMCPDCSADLMKGLEKIAEKVIEPEQPASEEDS